MKTARRLLIILVVIGFIATVAYPQQSANGQTSIRTVEFYPDVWVESTDGIRLSANMYVPTSSDPDERFPVIILTNSWTLTEWQYRAQTEQLAERGYIVFSYSSRGWGESEGMIDSAGPKDMADITVIIDWLLANSPADVENIAMGGISYGAGLGLLGAAHDERIKTVFAMSGWADIADALYGGQTTRLIWGAIIFGSGHLTGTMDPYMNTVFTSFLFHTNLEEVLAWTESRSPLSYVDDYNERQVPIFMAQNLGDELFHPNSLISLYEQLDYPEKRLNLNLGNHAASEMGGLFGLPNLVWDDVNDWLDYWLKGEETGIMDDAPFTIEDRRSGTQHMFETWPSPSVIDRQYTLGPRDSAEFGTLGRATETMTGSDTIQDGRSSGINTGIPVITPYLEAISPIIVPVDIESADPAKSIVYLTDPLPRDTHVVGTPNVTLWVSSSRPRAQLIAHLIAVQTDGTARLITHGPFTIIDQPIDTPLEISIDLISVSFELERGERLALALDTQDTLYTQPTQLSYAVTVHYGDNFPATLTVPAYEPTTRNYMPIMLDSP